MSKTHDFMADKDLTIEELKKNYGDVHPAFPKEMFDNLMKTPEFVKHFGSDYWKWVEGGIEYATKDSFQDIVDVTSLTTVVVEWHKQILRQLLHLSQIPEGFEVSMQEIAGNEEKTTTLTLSGDILTAYRIGVSMALAEFKDLPFVYTTVESSEPQSMDTTDEPSSTVH